MRAFKVENGRAVPEVTAIKKVEPSMPARNKSKVSDAQRRKIAAGKVLGRTAKSVAAETGLSQRTVERQLKDPRTVAYIQEFKERDYKDLSESWRDMIRGLRQDVKSKDFVIRRAARVDLIRVLEAGEPPLDKAQAPGTDSTKGDFTLEELLAARYVDLVEAGKLPPRK
jgi:hypothetical protein